MSAYQVSLVQRERMLARGERPLSETEILQALSAREQAEIQHEVDRRGTT